MNNSTTEKYVERFPSMVYGTLVAALAGWKAFQRYKQIPKGTTIVDGGWLLDIFIRQVISAGRMIHEK